MLRDYLLMRFFLLAIAFAMLAAPVFADVGPGPASPTLSIVLYQNGERFAGDANATYLCSLAKTRGPPSGAVAPGDMPLNCSGGVCVIGNWYYKFNPCFASAGMVQVTTANGTSVSREFTMATGGNYGFDMDVDTGRVTNFSQAGQDLCGSSGFVLGSLVLGAVFCFSGGKGKRSSRRI